MSKRLRILPRELTEPHVDRLPIDHPRRDEILIRHQVAMAVDAPFYTDPETGLKVLTAKVLADQGKCCAMQCRHCPYKR